MELHPRRECPFDAGGNCCFGHNGGQRGEINRVHHFSKAKECIAKAKGFYPAANFDASLAYVNKRIDATNEALASNAAILIQDKATAESHNDAYNRADQEAVEMAKALPKQFSQPVVDAYASATADLVSRYDSLRSDAASNDAYLREYLGQD